MFFNELNSIALEVAEASITCCIWFVNLTEVKLIFLRAAMTHSLWKSANTTYPSLAADSTLLLATKLCISAASVKVALEICDVSA